MGRRKLTWMFWDQTAFIADGCLIWTGYKIYSRGLGHYGRIYWEGRHQLAHRVAWKITLGTIPKGLQVCHHCDNPLCVRPDHLFLGTQKDNMQDAKRKDRGPKAWRKGAGEAASDPAAELPPPLPEDAPAPSIFDPEAISAKVATKLAKEKAAAK